MATCIFSGVLGLDGIGAPKNGVSGVSHIWNASQNVGESLNFLWVLSVDDEVELVNFFEFEQFA